MARHHRPPTRCVPASWADHDYCGPTRKGGRSGSLRFLGRRATSVARRGDPRHVDGVGRAAGPHQWRDLLLARSPARDCLRSISKHAALQSEACVPRAVGRHMRTRARLAALTAMVHSDGPGRRKGDGCRRRGGHRENGAGRGRRVNGQRSPTSPCCRPEPVSSRPSSRGESFANSLTGRSPGP